jgi:hypothetical protein
MGKRELVLIVGFIILGTVLYQLTAPENPQAGRFSIRGMIDSVRRGMASHREYPGEERRQAVAIDRAIAEVRIAGAAEVRIEGIDGDTAELRIQVFSTGADEPEARALAARTALRTQPSGDLLLLEFSYPREGRQRTALTVRMPRRLRARVTRTRTLEVRDLAGLELDGTRSHVTVTGIRGALRGSHAGGTLNAEAIQDVDLALRSVDATLTNIAGSTRLTLTGGQLEGRDLRGRIDVEAARADVEIAQASGALTADLTQGRLEVTGLSQNARVDARRAELRLELASPIAVTALTTDETITVSVPSGAGFTLDATVDDGEIRLPAEAPAVTSQERSRQARGPLKGGGPTLALRTTRGDIVVREY